MADMNGRIVMVTGATDGIGKITAHELAKMGATVIVVGRNPQKGAQVVSEIKSATSNQNIEFMQADLSLMRDVRKLADDFKSKYDRLHVLVNNAGAVFNSRQDTAEGYEMTFALNHLNYFLLTNLLLDTIKASGTAERKARIVNVSSEAHQVGGLNIDDLQSKKGYIGMMVYGRSKLMNVMFTYELARRLKAENAPVTTNVLHPGFVASRFGRNNGIVMNAILSIIQLGAISPEKGAQTSIYLASSPEVENVSGKYFSESKAKATTAASMDEAAQKRLWEMSEQIVGLGVPTTV